MKNLLTYLLFFCLFTSYTYSQDTIMMYFDEEWEEISDTNLATYYRIAYQINNGLWMVNDYYKGIDKIQMTGFFKTREFIIKHGIFVYYYENGNKSSEGFYIKNKRSGEWNYWYESGKMKSKEVFKNGQIEGVEGYFKNGVKKYSGKLSRGKRNGEWNQWNSDSRKILTGTYKNGIPVGVWIRYFPDGQMKIKYTNYGATEALFGGIVRIN